MQLLKFLSFTALTAVLFTLTNASPIPQREVDNPTNPQFDKEALGVGTQGRQNVKDAFKFWNGLGGSGSSAPASRNFKVPASKTGGTVPPSKGAPSGVPATATTATPSSNAPAAPSNGAPSGVPPTNTGSNAPAVVPPSNTPTTPPTNAPQSQSGTPASVAPTAPTVPEVKPEVTSIEAKIESVAPVTPSEAKVEPVPSVTPSEAKVDVIPSIPSSKANIETTPVVTPENRPASQPGSTPAASTTPEAPVTQPSVAPTTPETPATTPAASESGVPASNVPAAPSVAPTTPETPATTPTSTNASEAVTPAAPADPAAPAAAASLTPEERDRVRKADANIPNAEIAKCTKTAKGGAIICRYTQNKISHILTLHANGGGSLFRKFPNGKTETQGITSDGGRGNMFRKHVDGTEVRATTDAKGSRVTDTRHANGGFTVQKNKLDGSSTTKGFNSEGLLSTHRKQFGDGSAVTSKITYTPPRGAQ